MLSSLLLPLILPFLALGSPVLDAQDERQQPLIKTDIRPLVLWHGLGDSHSSPGMVQFQDLIKEVHPGIFTHSIYIDPDLQEDRRAGFYGNVDEQVELVAAQLANITELSGGFDAIGFSQGGQFLRAYVERYNDPPIRNLITFGSQHMGISDIPACRPYDLLCQLARGAARGGVYTEWAQEHLVQAQYYRDPDQLPLYLTSNLFLTSINNEHADPALRNATYAKQLAGLEKLVLVIFARDKTVVPKESAWFGSYAPLDEEDSSTSTASSRGRVANWEKVEEAISRELNVDEDEDERMKVMVEDRTIIPMRAQPLYTEDWIGLRELDERGAVDLLSCDGEHMQLAKECWEPIVKKYVGSAI
ncbi:alpha/beta-hydrolase [Stereum hirsutum FP-91666 SS1]|uniref:alpha/beta-hydrolase n=1 Tax=Stereum hirsutum (strain FP-91666) TaxID=721885 RepID=UPI0004449889|nr:alpha/beta-hydrolase [Stereum hirsutum FP-91666 SS1]EIM81182.1 alpha/beta-hydrolase [Stereum hirsutum FP-91666 SS1]